MKHSKKLSPYDTQSTLSLLEEILLEETNDCFDFTPKEGDIMCMIRQGLSSHEISDQCQEDIAITKAHIGNILAELCIDQKVQRAVRSLYAHQT